jgi:RND family efflux transporter MFP subunit
VGDITALAEGNLPGRAKATQEVNLAFRVSGPLLERRVNVGDEVTKGDIIARIDPRDFQVALRGAQAEYDVARAQLQSMRIARPEEIAQLKATVDKAEAQFRLAENDLQRAEQMIESRSISRAEFEDFSENKVRAEAELNQVRESLRIGERGARPEDILAKEAEIRALDASLDAAKNQLEYSTLAAPFNGTIVAAYVENFEDVRAKQPIVRLIDDSRIEMIINLPEGSIGLCRYVTDIVCTFDALPGVELSAQIKEIGTEASRTTRTYPVTLIMDQPEGEEVLPGMAGRARGRIERPDEAAIAGVEIPESAVFVRDGKQFVWVIDSDDGKSGEATLREITATELSARGLRQVTGLLPGELIATAGVHYLKEGQPVRVLAAET